MLDRGSIFRDEELLELLRTSFVNVAVDLNELQSREGATGDFYRKVVLQRNGMHLGRSTQGHYALTPDGELLSGSNHRDAAMLVRHLRSALRRSSPEPVATPEQRSSEPVPPDGVAFVEVFARVLEAEWPAAEAEDEEERLRRESVGRDFLWITAEERRALGASPPRFPDTLARRIARFHVVDGTRCAPLVWNRGDAYELAIRAEPGEDGVRVSGRAACRTEDDRRGYTAEVGGVIGLRGDELERFDLTVRATFRGDGKWSTGAPPEPYVVGIAFRLAESPFAQTVFPFGASRLQEYLDAPCTSL